MSVDWDKPIQTKDGRPARLLGLLDHPTYPRVVASTNYGDNSCERVDTYTNGGMLYREDSPHPSDIINVPQKHVRWVNCYPPSCMHFSGTWETREEADDMAYHPKRIACIRIEFEEGEGL